jgi:hypothetical protein
MTCSNAATSRLASRDVLGRLGARADVGAPLAELVDGLRPGLAERLRAGVRAGDWEAVGGIAQAHRLAGAALAPLTSNGDGLPSAGVHALTATAGAYAALASAARARQRRPYRTASRAVSGAEANLRRTMTQLYAAARPASRGPAPTTSAPAPVDAAPVIDLSIALFALLGAFVLVLTAVLLAVRATRRPLD